MLAQNKSFVNTLKVTAHQTEQALVFNMFLWRFSSLRHPRESGDPENPKRNLDSRLHGNDNSTQSG
jgi:hypothetical protein